MAGKEPETVGSVAQRDEVRARWVRIPRRTCGGTSEEENVELLIFLLVVFLIALVAGFGWRAGTRRRL